MAASRPPHSSDTRFDAIIVGGGMVGLSAAIALDLAGARVALIDRADPAAVTDTGFDGRASALAFATVRMLETLDIWPHMADQAQPILGIRVSDGALHRGVSPLHLHFDHEELNDGPLGQMVENRHIRLGLFAALENHPRIAHFAPASVTALARDDSGAHATLTDAGGNTHHLTGQLLIGADGRNSMVRDHAGIPSRGWSYRQSGIVCAIETQESHVGIAHEKFLPGGPFAILPLRGNRASLVWTEKSRLVDTIMNLDDAAFTDEVARRVGDFLGEVRVVGGRWSWPLGLHWAERYTDHRLALVGDAAHGIHPIAGQGLNMGLRDVAALADMVAHRLYAGLDMGTADATADYEARRRFDNVTLAAVTDGLNRLFSNDLPPIRLARDMGLAAVNRIPKLKRFFMAHARGTVGTLPALLQGLPAGRAD
ncbi:UbiH/UbiF/VisC/COQ6 family ubiquinone biosynthesis hydroxylase [Yunchengibacter salinarum]|uniref:UbiH/UbiF/VisC/COQ6 family ubiquinone biosynthesis hydroxylase n=1 Tax=Yunchengibacter salinarum TaxID=3133399 RepID=UPI0035B66853